MTGARATKLFQVAVALPLLVPQVAGKELASVFLYYGALILVLPGIVERIAGAELTPVQRGLLTLGLGLHGYGILLDFYWQLWWWDVVTHVFSAALLAAGLYAALLAAARSADYPTGPWLHVAVVALVLFGGVGWEVYEVVAPWQTIYPTGDAIKDLVSDTIGWGIMAVMYTRLLGDFPEDLADRLTAARRYWRRARWS